MVHPHGLHSPSAQESGKLIGEIVGLRGYPNEQTALKLLRETASLVKPIMQKHGWRVPILMEFWENPSWNTSSKIILGYNEGRGRVIALRLRKPNDRHSFYPVEELVHVMLHELTHNVHNNHDDKFHALLDQLEREYSQIRKSGYNGEGFYYADGQKLGRGRGFYNPELIELRRHAITGESRLNRLSELPARPKPTPVLAPSMPSSAPQLGGKPVQKGDRDRIAEAAEKRRREAESCGLGHGRENEMNAIIKRGMENGIHEKPEPLNADEMAAVMLQIQMLEEAENEARSKNGGQALSYIYISDDEVGDALALPPDNGLKDKQKQSASTGLGPTTSSSEDSRPTIGQSSGSYRRTNHEQSHQYRAAQWACNACTLLNPDAAMRCVLCEMSR